MESRCKWNVSPVMSREEYSAMSIFGTFLAKLLFVRKIYNENEGIVFIKKSGLKYDPYLMMNMEEIVSVLKKAISKKKKIFVYGDYDADGVTASAILIKTFRALGGTAYSYIPDRFTEGYGINKEALQKIKEDGGDLIISVDCGIRSIEEAAYAKEINIPLIITDHHEPGETIPEALYVLSPKQPGDKYPDKNLAGCGIALKIAEALTKNAPENNLDFDELLIIASIGTIADLVPLKDENRSLVKAGIRLLKTKKSIFLDAMAETAGFGLDDISGSLVSFTIAPRLNAAGRMKHASLALDLLLSETFDEAKKIAEEIEKLNSERQRITQKIQQTAEEKLTGERLPSVICLKDSSFPMGIVGLAAAKITEKFYRPCFIGASDEGSIRLSGRSIPEFNMIKAMDSIPEVFLKYGGHSMAAGATVSEEKWDDFVKKINNEAAEAFKEKSIQPEIYADLILPAKLVNLKLYDTISLLEPFGEGNRQPLFEIDNLKVINHNAVGADKKHLKLCLQGKDAQPIDAIAFWSADKEKDITDYIDVICSIEKNSWHGSDNVQLRIEDMRSSKQQKYKEYK